MTYYVPYNEDCDINYIYLFLLYKLAKSSKNQWIKSTITYSSLKDLANKMNELANSIVKNQDATAENVQVISTSTISRISNNTAYNKYFQWNKNDKTIILLNDFRKTNSSKIPFVSLDENTVLFLIAQNNNLLVKYYLYLKYHCGSSKAKQTDTTAKQFLNALGYSTKSGSLISKISEYNSLFVSNGLLKIKKSRDDNGRERNTYSMPQ